MHRMDASDTNPREGRRLFGVFEFELRTGELSKDGRPVALRPQAQRLLALLVASAGTVVSRAEIQRELWSGDTFVDFDQGVNHAIRELRAALGDVAEAPRFIQTLPRRGYRFVAPVRALEGALPSTEVTAPTPVAQEPSSPGVGGGVRAASALVRRTRKPTASAPIRTSPAAPASHRSRNRVPPPTPGDDGSCAAGVGVVTSVDGDVPSRARTGATNR